MTSVSDLDSIAEGSAEAIAEWEKYMTANQEGVEVDVYRFKCEMCPDTVDVELPEGSYWSKKRFRWICKKCIEKHEAAGAWIRELIKDGETSSGWM